MRKIENIAWAVAALLFAVMVAGFAFPSLRWVVFYVMSPMAIAAVTAYILNRVGRMRRLSRAMKTKS